MANMVSQPNDRENSSPPSVEPEHLASSQGLPPEWLDPFGTNESHDTDQEFAQQHPDVDPWLKTFAYNRYQVLSSEPILQGGMGVVYTALDQTFHRLVAMKQLRPDYADNTYWKNRFQEEATINAYLDRILGVIPVHDWGVFANGRPYFTMPLHRSPFSSKDIDPTELDRNDVEWHPLSTGIRLFHERLNAGPESYPSSFQERGLKHFVKCLAFACRTMNSVHRQGIVHLDLKPGNILLTEHRNGCWVIDWGLAACLGNHDFAQYIDHKQRHRLRVDWTMLLPKQPRSPHRSLKLEFERQLHGQTFGTSSYLSPELANGEMDNIGVAADVFALGAILYAILLGRPPYLAETVEETFALARKCDTLDFSSVRGRFVNLSEETCQQLVTICQTAMHKEPSKRHASAKQLAQALMKVKFGRRAR
jgi:eukaryotic-like serine/threonine-protein kinase